MNRFFLLAAVAAMIFASCTKEGNETGKVQTQLSIKLTGVVTEKAFDVTTRTVEAPGSNAAGTITLVDGHIFVADAAGVIFYSEALNIGQATGAGQTLAQKVALDSRVYIVGNLPSDFPSIASLTTVTAVRNATSAISTQTDYKQAALANADGQAEAIGAPVSGVSSVSVALKPLISRIELVQVSGGGMLTAFNVTGVYVDDYYPLFTYGGGYDGTLFSQAQSLTFTGMGDAGTWAATGSPLISTPGGGNVWAYQVAAGGLPRFIIRLTGVKYNPGTGEVDLSANTYYLTVTGYTALGSTVFERGKIYRVGNIAFNHDDLSINPNQSNVDLKVNVTIVEWEIVTPGAVL